MNRLYIWLMLRFIRNSMHHNRGGHIPEVFKAIAEGMHKNFTEDNIATLQASGAHWMSNAILDVASEVYAKNHTCYCLNKNIYKDLKKNYP